MSLPGRQLFRLAALLGACHLLSASVLTRAATNQPASAPSNSSPAHSLVSGALATPTPMPPIPSSPSPIGFFRELLAMKAAEREQALTNRSPESQRQILDKVREYESLDADDRELRLRVTELRWYLRPLMTAPATNRAARLALIPEPNRTLVEDRLRVWDEVPLDVQKELFGLEPTLQYFSEIEGRSDQQRHQILTNITPARREMLEKGIQQWDAMSEDQRQSTLNRFNQFFQLTTEEKEKALQTLSEPERQQIERTLQTFGKLPPAKRAQCISSFDKFATLSLEERQQFLKNAERWKLMSPGEREAWRQLVGRLPPLPRRPPPPPPLPPPRPGPTVVTNGK